MNTETKNNTVSSTEESTKANTQLSVPQGTFELVRNPVSEKLQAWEAADEYLLKHINEKKLLTEQSKILIVNDSFGALSITVANYKPIMVTDSFLAQQATLSNLSNNNLLEDSVSFCHGLDNDLTELKITFDLVLIKIPKSLALLEHQLRAIKTSIGSETQIVAAGMSRSIHKKTLKLFEKTIGPTTTSLAWKKSRLIFATPDQSIALTTTPDQDKFVIETDRKFTLTSYSNVFSRDHLDEGTHLLLDNMHISDQTKNIADLGCGNGVVGIIAASLNAKATLLFVDESFMAVESAKENFKTAFGDNRQAAFKVTDCLQGVEDESMDLVLNNPPFHQQNAISDATAWQMFMDARRVLKTHGEFYVVGNRHLGYHKKLKKVFGNCEVVKSNEKFVVLKTIKKEPRKTTT
jgi:16S rRNA (guanine1207-N2)-methyltransferase